jgi:long-chain acyl-CoA synthetase
MAFPGYWDNPGATKEMIDEDGWLHTGDLGALDDGGFLAITGRKKDLIITASGKNVAPAVLEDRLRATGWSASASSSATPGPTSELW